MAETVLSTPTHIVHFPGKSSAFIWLPLAVIEYSLDDGHRCTERTVGLDRL